jgi:hypothetical protein
VRRTLESASGRGALQLSVPLATTTAISKVRNEKEKRNGFIGFLEVLLLLR